MHVKELLVLRPTLKLGDRPLSTIRDPRLLHPQSGDEWHNLTVAQWVTLMVAYWGKLILLIICDVVSSMEEKWVWMYKW